MNIYDAALRGSAAKRMDMHIMAGSAPLARKRRKEDAKRNKKKKKKKDEDEYEQDEEEKNEEGDEEQEGKQRRVPNVCPVLARQIPLQRYADLATVEREIDRLLRCEHDRSHPFLQSATYIKFRQEMIHHMTMSEMLSSGVHETVAQVYLPQGLIARLILAEEKCSSDEAGGPRRESMRVELLWRADFYSPVPCNFFPHSLEAVTEDDGIDASAGDTALPPPPPPPPPSNQPPRSRRFRSATSVAPTSE
jgi:hypothetical protein